MGKGDKKSKRGKIVLGTYGARRPRKETKKIIAPSSPHVEEKIEAEPEVKMSLPKKKLKTAASH